MEFEPSPVLNEISSIIVDITKEPLRVNAKSDLNMVTRQIKDKSDSYDSLVVLQCIVCIIIFVHGGPSGVAPIVKVAAVTIELLHINVLIRIGNA